MPVTPSSPHSHTIHYRLLCTVSTLRSPGPLQREGWRAQGRPRMGKLLGERGEGSSGLGKQTALDTTPKLYAQVGLPMLCRQRLPSPACLVKEGQRGKARASRSGCCPVAPTTWRFCRRT